jgi:hypothetical protein
VVLFIGSSAGRNVSKRMNAIKPYYVAGRRIFAVLGVAFQAPDPIGVTDDDFRAAAGFRVPKDQSFL